MSELGKVLKDKYCLLECIGKGGMGEVYLARDLQLGKLWAVKVLDKENQTEADILKKLHHYMLPRIVDGIKMGEKYYLVMDYIRGESLAALLKQKKKFRKLQTACWGVELCEVLSYLHRQQPPIIYGDMKPDNLMVSPDGKLYLVDFGISILDKPGRKKMAAGTKGYAAPEQLQGKMTPKVDVYGLGKTLEAISYGTRSLFLWKIIYKCTRKDPEKRYENCNQVKKDLLQWKKRIEKRQWKILPFQIAGIVTAFLAGMSMLPKVVPVMEKEEAADFWQQFTNLNQIAVSTLEEGNSKKRIKMLNLLQSQTDELLEDVRRPEEEQRLLFLQATIYQELKQWENAEEVFQIMLKKWPDEVEIYSQYGEMLLKRGENVTNIQRLYEQALRVKGAKQNWNLKMLKKKIEEGEAANAKRQKK